MIPYG
jgi:hypothetical protein